MKYYITYSITTEESAESGDFAEYGEIGDTESLATALDWFNSTRTCEVVGVESISGHYAPYGKRLTLYISNGMEYRTGEQESRGLHVHGISESSAKRVAKLAGIQLDNF